MKLLPEDKHIEYKKGDGTLPKEFWPTYSAFSNSEGGKVFFGVSEPKPNHYEITGVKNIELYKETLLNEMNNPEKVSYGSVEDSDISEEIIDGKTVLVVNIKEAPYSKKPVFINNRMNSAYKRVNSADQLMSHEELKYYFANSQEDIDNELLEQFDLSDINLDDVRLYKKLIQENSDFYKEDISDMDFLLSIGAFRKNRETKEILPTVGGLLFFGKYNSIIEKFPSFQLDYFRKNLPTDVRWKDRVSSGDMNFPELNLFSFYNIVSQKLYQTLEDKFIQDDDMRRTSYIKDMRASLREVIVNTLMHAYYGGDISIKISAYEDFYEFFNPGKMRISKEDFLLGGISKVRNSIIATLFRRVGLAERAGYGGQKILRVAQDNSLKAPEILLDEFTTTVRLWKVDYLETIPNLSENAEKVFQYLYKEQIAKRREIKSSTNLSDHYLKKALTELQDLELVIKIGDKKSTMYSLKLSSEMRTSQNQKFIRQLEKAFRR